MIFRASSDPSFSEIVFFFSTYTNIEFDEVSQYLIGFLVSHLRMNLFIKCPLKFHHDHTSMWTSATADASCRSMGQGFCIAFYIILDALSIGGFRAKNSLEMV